MRHEGVWVKLNFSCLNGFEGAKSLSVIEDS